jgi:hypothetical protein
LLEFLDRSGFSAICGVGSVKRAKYLVDSGKKDATDSIEGRGVSLRGCDKIVNKNVNSGQSAATRGG